MAIASTAAFLAIWPLDAIGPHEWVIIAVAAVLLFGKRLPDVGRWVGRSIVEFKKGVKSMQEEMSKAGEADDVSSPPVCSAEQQEVHDSTREKQ